jgi:hypothetical protein
MTQVIDSPLDFISFDGGRLSRKVNSQVVPGAFILGLSALIGSAWMSCMRPAAIPNAARAPAAAAANVAASNSYGALFDPGFFSGSKPVSLSQNFTLDSALEPDSNLEPVAPKPSVAIAEPENVSPPPTPAGPQLGESAPLPAPRPPELGAPASHGPFQIPGRRLAQQNRKAVLASAPPDNRNFLEKLFGTPQSQPSGRVLAYAAPQDGVPGPASRAVAAASPRADRGTAVYDVAAHTVYLPDGTRLEAHSGLGDRLDDPRHVNERNRGATPPNVYELTPREQLFHGVQALRLTPVGGGDAYGRTGLLAHTYMLGPRGDSNGCVSFRDYKAFLQAYQNGQIKRLVVVGRQS